MGPRLVSVRIRDGVAEAVDLRQPDERPLPLETELEVSDGDVLAGVEKAGRWHAAGDALARAKTLKAGLYEIVAGRGLDLWYPEAVIHEADAWAEDPQIDDETLQDLSHLPFITIDNDDSRDLDQAMYMEREGQGTRVLYAVADASHFVRPGSALLDEALRRGATYYLPGLSVPMLPRQLSEGLVSLNQDCRRRALVFDMHLDAAGRCRRTELYRARIRSVKKLSYRRVQRSYDEPSGSGFERAPFGETLRLLREVGMLRLEDARRRHVVDHNRREVEVKLSPEESLGFTVLTRDRLEVERYNEQLSLLCNVEGARLLERSRGKEWVQAVFRVHPEPSVEQLDHFTAQVRALVRLHDLDPGQWIWRRRRGGSREFLVDYLDRLPRERRFAGVRRVIERQALLANMRSHYEGEPGIHHGVGAPVYARFSSPMREVVGIFTHKEALEALQGPRGGASRAVDEELRDRVVEVGNRARDLQRRLTKEANGLVLDVLFRSELSEPLGRRPVRRALVLGLRSRVVYVELEDPPVELKLYLRDLELERGEALRVDRHGVQLLHRSGRGGPVLRAGDALRLELKDWDTKHRRWRFHVVET